MKRVLAVVSALVLLLALTGSAAAAPSDTPNGFTGACNMVQSWPGVRVGPGVGVQPGGGMENAMTRNLNGNGNDGMNRAVDRSGGYWP